MAIAGDQDAALSIPYSDVTGADEPRGVKYVIVQARVEVPKKAGSPAHVDIARNAQGHLISLVAEDADFDPWQDRAVGICGLPKGRPERSACYGCRLSRAIDTTESCAQDVGCLMNQPRWYVGSSA